MTTDDNCPTLELVGSRDKANRNGRGKTKKMKGALNIIVSPTDGRTIGFRLCGGNWPKVDGDVLTDKQVEKVVAGDANTGEYVEKSVTGEAHTEQLLQQRGAGDAPR